MVNKNITQEKSCSGYTLFEVAEQFGLPLSTLRSRCALYGIKGKTFKSNAEKEYTKSQVNTLLSKNKSLFYSPSLRIKIIERHLTGEQNFKIAHNLKIDRRNTNKIIADYKNNGSLILESKLNYTIV